MLAPRARAATLQAEHREHEERAHHEHREQRDRRDAAAELDAAGLVRDVVDDGRQLEAHHEEDRALEDELDRAPVLHVRQPVLRREAPRSRRAR